MEKSKPIIETMINSIALAFTSFAAVNLTKIDVKNSVYLKGLGLLLVGMTLEFIKYHGRKNKYW